MKRGASAARSSQAIMVACVVSGCGWALGTRFDDARPRPPVTEGMGGAPAEPPAPQATDPAGAAGELLSDGGADDPPSCAGAPTWTDVELLEPVDGAIAASSLALELAAFQDPQTQRWCSVVLATFGLVASVDCPVVTDSLLAFGKQRSAEPGNLPRPVEELGVLTYNEGRAGLRLAWLKRYVDFSHPTATWQRQPAQLAERLTLIGRDADGYAVARRVDASQLRVGLRLDAWPRARTVPGFGDDGSLVAFCSLDECAEVVQCAPLALALSVSTELRRIHALGGVFFGDSTGDGAADAVVFNTASVALRRADPSRAAFAMNESWTQNAYFGWEQNLLADADGDGRADALVSNADGVHARLSTGRDYALQSLWANGHVTGPIHAGNVDGSLGEDLVNVEQTSIAVRLSRGAYFADAEVWATLDAVPSQLDLADVTGDGLADVLLVEGGRLTVLRSLGSAFAPAEVWLHVAAPTAPGWSFADVNGDGAADAIALDASGSRVYLARGERFELQPSRFERRIPLGERGNRFADVNGDGRADAIVQRHFSIDVHPATDGDFGAAQLWSELPYYGGL
jgi:hypothetical protein